MSYAPNVPRAPGDQAQMLAYYLQQHGLSEVLAAASRDSIIVASAAVQAGIMAHKPSRPGHITTPDQALTIASDAAVRLIFMAPDMLPDQRRAISRHFDTLPQLDGLRDIILPASFGMKASAGLPARSAEKPQLEKPPVLVLGNGGIEMDFFVDQLRQAGLGVPRRYLDDIHLQWHGLFGQLSLSRLMLRSLRLLCQTGENQLVMVLPFRLLNEAVDSGLLDIEAWQAYLNKQGIRTIVYQNRDKISRALLARATEDLPHVQRFQRLVAQKRPRPVPEVSGDELFSDITGAALEELIAKKHLAPLSHLLMVTHEEFKIEPARFMEHIAEHLEDNSLKAPTDTWPAFEQRHFKDYRGAAIDMLRQVIDKLGIFVNRNGSLVNLQTLLDDDT